MNKTLWICLFAIGVVLSGCSNSSSSHNMAPESVAARKVAAIKTAVDQALQARHADPATQQTVLAQSKVIINKNDKDYTLLLAHAEKKQRWADIMQKQAEQARETLLQAALERTRLARLLAKQETIVANAQKQADLRQKIARNAMLENLKAQKLLADVRSAQRLAALTIGLQQPASNPVQLAQNKTVDVHPEIRQTTAKKTHAIAHKASHPVQISETSHPVQSSQPAITKVADNHKTMTPLGDAVHGQKLAQKCQLCHSFEPGKKGRFGPNLYAIIGQPAGKTPDFHYSHALAKADFIWNEEQLAAFICHSGKAIKKLTADDRATTKMPPQNTCGQDARDVVAYLRNLKMQASNQPQTNGNPS